MKRKIEPFSIRVKKCFAIWPITLSDGTEIWLEWYFRYQYYGIPLPYNSQSISHHRANAPGKPNYWVTFEKAINTDQCPLKLNDIVSKEKYYKLFLEINSPR